MIDINDFSYKLTTRHGKPVKNKVYRHACNSCGADKGYLQKNHNTPYCNKCAKVGSTLSEDTKQKMSNAATKRYNDPSWIPQLEGPGYEGRKVRQYKSRTTPLQRKMRHNMKTLLWQKLITRSLNKDGSTFDLLGYDADALIKHLESKFESGMTWDNYGIGGWEIDHAVPDSWFQYSSTQDQGFKDSWSLNNLQPMWASLNRSKGDRYTGKEGI
jgi:hypothetical protein